MSGIRIIGLGNTLRGDDAAGILVVRRLKPLLGAQAKIIEAEMASTEVLEFIEGANVAILVDAARSGRPAGTIHRIDASTIPIRGDIFPHSTHAFNARDALELGRSLGRLPPRVIVYGIEAQDMTAGAAVSPPVAEAVDQAVERIVQEVMEHECTRSS